MGRKGIKSKLLMCAVEEEEVGVIVERIYRKGEE